MLFRSIALFSLFPFVANAQSSLSSVGPIDNWNEYYEKIYDAVHNQNSKDVVLWTKRFLSTPFEPIKGCWDGSEDLTDPEWLLNQVLIWNHGHTTIWAEEARLMLVKANDYRLRFYPDCRGYRSRGGTTKAIDFKRGSFQVSNLQRRTILIHYTGNEPAILIVKPIKKAKSKVRVMIVDHENGKIIQKCNKIDAQCRLDWIPECENSVCGFEVWFQNDSDTTEWIRAEANY